jgi:hypothetical protein
MSTSEHRHDHQNGEPMHADVAYEKVDVSPNAIYIYLIGLAVAVLLSYAVCVFVLRGTTKVAESSDTPLPPIRQEMGSEYRAMPPEPRLQGVPGHSSDPQVDLREKMKQDTDANERYDWVDQNAGIAQIPVKDAMKIIAEKGLPGALASEPK